MHPADIVTTVVAGIFWFIRHGETDIRPVGFAPSNAAANIAWLYSACAR
jgi:hypothetical protein